MFERVIMINGVPRSGTSWLGEIINSNEDVKYKFQPFYSYIFRDISLEKASLEEIHRFFVELYNYNELYLDQILQRRKNIIPNFKNKEKNPSVLVFKSVRKHYVLSNILEKIENVKVICIVRNPIDSLKSWISTKMFSSNWIFENEWEYAQSMSQFLPSHYFGFHKWKEGAALFLYLSEKYPEKVMLVKYNELANNCIEKTSEIFRFCELEMKQQTIDFITESQNKDIKHENSVFKHRKNNYVEVTPKITDKIKNDLKGTVLEQFLG